MGTKLSPALTSILNAVSPQAVQSVTTAPPKAVVRSCTAPPGFTWVGSADSDDGLYMPLSSVPLLTTPVNGPQVAGQSGIFGCYNPIAFQGLGMQIGPFTFPWTIATMPSAPSAAGIAAQQAYQAATGTAQYNTVTGALIPTTPGDAVVGTCGMSDYNNVNGKLCPAWTMTISDWTQLPIGLAEHLGLILLSDIEGDGKHFGNFWNNKGWLPNDGTTPTSITNYTTPVATTTYTGDQAAAATPGEPISMQSYRQWITALGIAPDQNYYINFIPVQGNNLAYGNGHTYADVWYEGVPVTQFDHPDGVSGRYGIWLALEHANGQANTPYVLRIVVDSLADAASRLPQESIWGEILDALNPLNWPGMLLDAIEAVGHAIGSLMEDLYDAAGNLICDVASNPTLVAAAIKGVAASQGIPPNKTAGAAANIASLAAQQCAPTPPNCALPANAALTQCLPVAPPVGAVGPWYTQWYVIVPAVALVGYLLLKDDGEQKSP